ncbi:MAG TPA: DUF1552 domain-containing protein, partial [Polyangiaceae bacterium]|nr:DUF1552 domain-containing protein [Polyangiaceae bacterium]
MKRVLTRRMFLHSATGAALALPLLNDLGREAGAQTADPFKRLIVIFTPNGVIQKGWKASGADATFTLGETMKPFETDGHKSDLVVVPNLDMATALYDSPGGDAHALGIGCLLTGTQLLAGDQFKNPGGGGSGWPGGPSVDQVIADRVGATTKFRSLEFALKRAAGTIWTRMSYRAAAEPVAPLDDPSVAFDLIFGDVNTDPAVLARAGVRRKSVLDGTIDEFKALSSQISGNDKKKIEAHLAAISDLESRIDIIGGGGESCIVPEKPTLGQTAEVF